ncbi:MAG: hypothetical protein KDA21_01240 [Phycisphaerales bacterium]|nr:hypothetical protein [Phycisphaerales bacterium]
MPDRTPTTRLAPSPTGALHLGNARTFVVNWVMARQQGWKVVMRMEDLAGPRVRPETITDVYDILAWLGLDWDEGPWVQSADPEPYLDAMRRLAATQRVYPCELTRAQVEAAAAAPNLGDPHELRFDPALRPPGRPRTFTQHDTNWRFIVDDTPVTFTDAFAGPCTRQPGQETGDFVVWTRLGHPAYQLAVVVDDARQGITDIVRGDDLLSSTARQLLIYRALDLHPEPRHWHLPLVVGTDGRRLAKRHGDTRIASCRDAGIRPQRVLGLLAWWSGVLARPAEISLSEFVAGFDAGKMSRERIVFDEEADRWLQAH